MGAFFALLSATVFAINNVLVKKGAGKSKENYGFFIIIFLNAVCLSLIFLISLFFRHDAFKINWFAAFIFMIAGLFTTGLGRMTLYSSIMQIGPSRASAIRNSTPLFTVIFALVVLNEKITLLPGIGLTLIISGILLAGYIFLRDQSRGYLGTDVDQRQLWIGYSFALLSSFIFGVGHGLRKYGLNTMDDILFGAWIGTIASLFFLFIYQWIRGNFKKVISGMKKDFNKYFLIAGVLTSFGPITFFAAAHYMQISYVSAIASSEPLMTTIISALFIRQTETITKGTWLIVFMIFVGTTLMAIFTN